MFPYFLPYSAEIEDFRGAKNPKIFSILLKNMRGTGFEPAQALSYTALNRTRLATPAPPQLKRQLAPQSGGIFLIAFGNPTNFWCHFCNYREAPS